jgi:ribonucleoside-diphosphate reductase alpha chain
MYYAAVEESCALATVEGSYPAFEKSPTSMGILQPDLWSVTPLTQKDGNESWTASNGSLDWSGLREKVQKGLRNSLLLAPMPTASTSQILGYNECFEPFTSNLYTRRTLAGEFIVINKYLLKELMDLGLWSEDMKQQIVARNGSVQGISGIPEEIQQRYKTGWELKQRCLIDMAAQRGAFICQSQSLNLFVADPTYAKLTSMHFHAWKQGLKTGCYYLRTKAPVTAQKFTVDPRLLAAIQGNQAVNASETNSIADSDSDSESEDEETKKRVARRAMIDKLAAEYEASVEQMRKAKENGEEVCEMCSS